MEQEDSKKKLFLSATIHHQILQNSSNMFKSSSNWPPKNRPTPMCFSPQMSHLRPAGESPRRWTRRRFPRRCRRRRAGAANGRHGLRKLRRRGRRSAQARRQWHSGGIRGTTWQRRGWKHQNGGKTVSDFLLQKRWQESHPRLEVQASNHAPWHHLHSDFSLSYHAHVMLCS